MLDRQNGDIVWECDGCGDTLETETDDFDIARDMLKSEQWTTAKHGGEWVHFCPDCRDQL
jgi:hypothetical protein